jgi:hypothetical protein
VAGEHEARRVRELLRKTDMAALCQRFEPEDGGLAGALYERRVWTQEDAPTWRRSWFVGTERAHTISGTLLGSWAPTEFVLDGVVYASLFAFWRSLKYAEGDPQRAETAAGRGRGRGRRDVAFTYQGERIRVNSPAHGVLVGRATEAKVLAHAGVREALRATGTVRLAAGPSALGRYMAFALMVMRVRLFRS